MSEDAPTLDPRVGELFNTTPAPLVPDKVPEILQTLNSYKDEAQNARRSGLNPRDDKWSQNLDLYWNRYDFSAKASWQATETMPQVPSFVDRFSAALKEALIATPEGFYNVIDPSDTEGDLTLAIKHATDVWLSTSGRNQNGIPLPFSSVFEEQMTLGALMACSASVTWKPDTVSGRVAIETTDPRFVWLDHTYRNLYRLRQIEIDRHELAGMAKMLDAKGNPVYSTEAIANTLASLAAAPKLDEDRWKKELSGSGTEVSSSRKPITLDEWVAITVDSDGAKTNDKAVYVVANDTHLIRGPEKNPFWHGQDWLVFTPLIPTPLSVYGRSYMEDFGSVAKTFTELTNMIIDAVHTVSLKAFAVVPGMLVDPRQLADGITPNKTFWLDLGMRPEDFAKAIDLGTLPAESVRVWETMKSMLGEAAGINEIGLGQFAPNSRTSATEISQSQQNSSALVRSVAQTVETRFLDPILDRVWKTGFQHVKADDQMIQQAMGKDMFTALWPRRKDLIRRPITFQARGISNVIARGQMLKALMSLLGIIGSNGILLKAFLQRFSIEKLVDLLVTLSGVDMSKLHMSEREQMMRSVAEPVAQAQENSQNASSPSEQGNTQMSQMLQQTGLGA